MKNSDNNFKKNNDMNNMDTDNIPDKEENTKYSENIMKLKKKISTTIAKFKKKVSIAIIIFFILFAYSYYTFFMPSYQKRMLSNLNPFKSNNYSNETLDNIIDKDRIVEIPQGKAQNLVAFLEEFNKFEQFEENPSYGNALNILKEIELQAKEEKRYLDRIIAERYINYLNDQLYSIEAITHEEIDKELEIEEIEEIDKELEIEEIIEEIEQID